MDRMIARIFVVCLLLIGVVVVAVTADFHLPGNHAGYAPTQPINFSHRLHAGELSIDCTYCHYGARKSRTAGIPPANICMNCHQDVTSSFDTMLSEKLKAIDEEREATRIISPEIAKIYRALGLNPEGLPDPEQDPEPIQWTRVHHLADFVAFDHSVHVAGGIACQSCHGPVQTMDRLRQDRDLNMGFCLDCHRNTPAIASPDGHTTHVSTDCAACHY